MKKHSVEYMIYDENGDASFVKAQIVQKELANLLAKDNVELISVNKSAYPYRTCKRKK